MIITVLVLGSNVDSNRHKQNKLVAGTSSLSWTIISKGIVGLPHTNVKGKNPRKLHYELRENNS